MICPACDTGRVSVTVHTLVGDQSICRKCALHAGHAPFINAVSETAWLEEMWILDGSWVTRDRWRANVST